MYNQMIRKEILIVEDIVKPINDMTVVFDDMGLDDYISCKSHRTFSFSSSK